MLSVNVCLFKHFAFECRVQKADAMNRKTLRRNNNNNNSAAAETKQCAVQA